MKGWNSNVLPDRVLTKISAENRKSLGKAGLTAKECQERFEARSERELQALIVSDLLRREIYFSRSRMDRKTTNAKGTPDFICCMPFPLSSLCTFLAIECKHGSGVLSAEQEIERQKILKNNGDYHVVRSWADYSAILKEYHIK